MITPRFPAQLIVSGSSLLDYTDEPWEDIERDPRGIVLMWEPPDPKSTYIMGLDPTQGITGWSRATRTEGDHKTDNGAIEIFKVDGVVEPLYKVEGGQKVPDIDPQTRRQRKLYRDLQVAEFAAPCDAVEIARVTNVLGRIYAGGEEDQCTLIHEAWPGPGILTTQELLRLGYANLWVWEYIDSAAEETNRTGWRSTRDSQKLLWYRSRRHLMNRQAVIQSRFLLDELSNAEIDVDKMRARAAYGYHDDRMQAACMCFWAGHRWCYDVERTDEKVSETVVDDYQRLAPTFDDYQSFSDWKAAATAEWE
jgi:hypothetical protein